MLSEAVSTASVCFFTVNGWVFSANSAISYITDNVHKILGVWERTFVTSDVSSRRKYSCNRFCCIMIVISWYRLISWLRSWTSNGEKLLGIWMSELFISVLLYIFTGRKNANNKWKHQWNVILIELTAGSSLDLKKKKLLKVVSEHFGFVCPYIKNIIQIYFRFLRKSLQNLHCCMWDQTFRLLWA